MNWWEVAGWTCFALTVVPAFVYTVFKFAALGYYRGKREGQRSSDTRPQNGKAY